MSNQNRQQYLTSTVLDQDFLDASQDNLECKIEMVCEIETPSGTIYASDRNKYVGGTFYEALLNFPVISRTVGEWLANELQFSTLTLELSNVDGRFNELLQGGGSFGGWIGKSVEVKVGLAEQAGTYATIFRGTVTDIGGFKRSVRSVTVIARDDYDRVNQNFPTVVFKESDFPKIEDKNLGKVIPYILGDWTVALEPSLATIPAYAVNGKDPLVDFKERAVEITIASPGVFTSEDHNFDEGDPVQLSTSGALPTPLLSGTTYYIKTPTADTFNLSTVPFGAAINTSGAQSGDHRIVADPVATRRDVDFVISINANTFFDDEKVYLKRSENLFLIPSTEITSINVDKNEFTLLQMTGVMWVDGAEYAYDQGDEILVQVKGKDLGGYDDNIVWQARDILDVFGGLAGGDFASNWTTYRDKATPAQSAISTFKSRVWVQEAQPAMTFALSLLEQVRLEAFIDKDLKVKISSLHFEDFVSAPTYTVRNWDVIEGSFQTSTDDRNNFNRAQGAFNFLPDRNENARATAVHKNSAAITQMGKAISKRVVFPNLYDEATVAYQVVEILRLASSSPEQIEVSLTWRSFLLDNGGFVLLNVQIGSTVFENVPCLIRQIGFDPAGVKRPIKLWSFQMTPFPGYVPGYFGTIGGYNATISIE